MSESALKVLVVDDSLMFRKVVRDVLTQMPNVDVVGIAPDSEIALAKTLELEPDLVTLDVEMPPVDEVSVLREIKRRNLKTNVIMLSPFTSACARKTTAALELGAFDFVFKPATARPEESRKFLSESLLPKVEALAKRTSRCKTQAESPAGRAWQTELPASSQAKVIAIGISTGGPVALSQVIPKLPGDLPVPILIVQHMPPMFTESLAKDLDRVSQLKVQEAQAGQRLSSGHVFIAPGGKQMKVAGTSRGSFIRVTDDLPENNCRPSVDYLFRSIAKVYRQDALGIIMTGMGDDGVEGCRAMKQQGASIAAQDETSCVVYGMPGKVVDAGIADAVCNLEQISSGIVTSVQRRALQCN